VLSLLLCAENDTVMYTAGINAGMGSVKAVDNVGHVTDQGRHPVFELQGKGSGAQPP